MPEKNIMIVGHGNFFWGTSEGVDLPICGWAVMRVSRRDG
jgi:hypothetical protein